MKKLGQKGFGAVEILIVIVVVGLLGAVGWLVYSRQNTKQDANKPTQTSESKPDTITDEAKNTETTTKTPDPTEGWKTVTNDKYHFSYKYPTTNKCEDFVIETITSSQLYSLGERINNSGVRCSVSVQASASPLSVRVSVAGSTEDQPDFGDKQMQGNNYYKLQSKDKVTVSGVSGTKWHYVPSDDQSDEIYYYYFKYKDLGYVIVVNDNGFKLSAYDVTDLGNSIFGTFKFL